MRLLIALLLIIIFLLVFLKFLPFSKRSSVVINNKTFIVDLAKTDEQKTKGLSIYNNLPPDRGMLFPFGTPSYYAFWMKDMKFSIDIIYINNNKIVDIFSNVPPPSRPDEQLPIIKPKEKANYVLEINAGLSKNYGFKIGDEVKFYNIW